MNTLHIRGHSARSKPASVLLLFAAAVVDAGIAVLVFLGFMLACGISPVPKGIWPIAYFVILGLIWASQRYVLSRTLGEWIWGLGFPSPRTTVGARFGMTFESTRLTPNHKLTASFLTFAIWVSIWITTQQIFVNSPLWMTSNEWIMSPFLPSSQSETDTTKWSITPFFYSLGAWPKSFEGKPVFYSVPYEKDGPPNHFIGHVTARWDSPDITLTFEGPRTPEGITDRSNLRKCIIDPSSAHTIACLAVRERALSRHLSELQKPSLGNWSIRWFRVDDPALPDGEEAQGIYIENAGESRAIARFILVTLGGTHQAFTLNYVKTPRGLVARKLFEDAIGSLRVSDQLGPGRDWINKELENVQLDSLQTSENGRELAEKLSEVQGLLISKITVDPKSFDAFFHLAGTSMLLAQLGAKHATEAEFNDLGSVAKAMIANTYRFAEDVDSQEKRLGQMQNIFIESQKL